MKTSTVQFLKPSSMQVTATLHGLLGILFISGVTHAQVPATCADLQWPAGKSIQSQLPLNSPGAGKPTVVDSSASKAQAAQRKEHLTCDAKPLQSWRASPQSDAFAQRVAAALKAGKPGTTVLAQAIYVAEVFHLKAGAQGTNRPSDAWRTEQAQAWCVQQSSTADAEKLRIPTNLLTLGEAVQQLNPRAIALSWQVLGGLPVNQLKDGCSEAVKRFILNGAKHGNGTT